MGALILLRHGRSTANGLHILAGRAPGVALDETGRRQANELPSRLAGQRITAIVSSPLERCRATVAPLAGSLGLDVVVDQRIVEVDYGSWAGRSLGDLRTEPAWRTVQEQPSAMVFPEGESMPAVSARAVAAARAHAAAVADDASVVLCSHGDLIAMILADALGLHLDLFQRIVVAPASISVVRYQARRPIILGINLAGVLPTPPAAADQVDDQAGGKPGAAAPTGTTNGTVAEVVAHTAGGVIHDEVLGGIPGA